ncbi:methyltransferase domain-containing protein [Flagellimonas sp. HMM57]|uniref:class I SAM-dependent methyltransferase n=1 Tax=unclassified Flagellimonas TaxID=2644544 RepID=UPI0013D2F664|nr:MULTISPECIES: class I SAM-dependent methyltransferase [unclassified Flagellimonas]UII75302.1 methyltransferase domain-containing protein [Flagellimonas sp. HMM57]
MKTDIISSWEKNAAEWIKVIQGDSIPSRKYTNAAILDIISKIACEKIVDVGCGEGWLTRELSKLGLDAVGLDAIEQLLVEARKKGSEDYHTFTFEDIIAGKTIPNAPFDVAVFNFCLYLGEDLETLLKKTLDGISDNGTLLIQTLHPFSLVQNGLPYKSQWLSDSWKGLPGHFKDGHAWYARTFEDWTALMSNLKNVRFTSKEVLDEEQKPISLILKIKKVA